MPVIDGGMVDHQHHLAVHFVADFSAVEAAQRGPRSIGYPHLGQFHVDAAAGGVVGARFKVKPLGLRD